VILCSENCQHQDAPTGHCHNCVLGDTAAAFDTLKKFLNIYKGILSNDGCACPAIFGQISQFALAILWQVNTTLVRTLSQTNNWLR